MFDSLWESWKLNPGWKSDIRDIGWAEMLAIKLGLRLAIARGFRDTHFLVKSDNTGVIGALDGGSRNVEQNSVLQRITALLRV